MTGLRLHRLAAQALHDAIEPLLEDLAALLGPKPAFAVLSAHTPGYDGERLAALGGGVEWGRTVTDLEQDPCAGPDPDAGHGGQDPGKRVVIEHPLHVVADGIALLKNLFQ